MAKIEAARVELRHTAASSTIPERWWVVTVLPDKTIDLGKYDTYQRALEKAQYEALKQRLLIEMVRWP